MQKWFRVALLILPLLTCSTPGRADSAGTESVPIPPPQPISKESVSPFIQKVDDLVKNGNLGTAILFMRQELKKNPRNAELWVKIGQTSELEGSLSEAFEAFRTARALRPQDDFIVEEMTRIGVKLHPLDQTEEQRIPTTEEEKKASELFERALSQKMAGSLGESLKSYMDCVALDRTYLTNDKHGLIRLGLDFYAQRVTQNDPEGAYFHALFSEFSGNTNAAREEMSRFLDGNPQSGLAESARMFVEKIDRIASEAALPPLVAGETTIASPTSTASETMTATGSTATISILQGKESEQAMLQQIRVGGLEQQRKALEWLVKNRVKSEETIKTLTECLGMWEMDFQIQVLEAFQKIGPDAAPAFSAIEELTRSDNQALRIQAITTLAKGRISPTFSIPALITLLSDQNGAVANAALTGLVEFGPDALPYLSETLSNPDQTVREKGAMAAIMIENAQKSR